MSKMSQIKKDFLSAMKDSGKEKTKPYDSTATVTRIEGNTAWVHIDGGIDETPVQLTIDAKAGDTVKVRVSGGQAWLTGNGSAPPTDDTVAKEAKVTATDAGVLAGIAKQTADQAGKTATNYLSWSSTYGLVVSEDATEDVTEMTGGNTRITSDGMAVYSGQNMLASFGTETAIYTDDGTELAHFGYAEGNASSGTAIKPYYTFGVRTSGSTVGNYSVAQGNNVTASGADSFASGQGAVASGYASHSLGFGTVAVGEGQTVVGRYNVSSAYYPFIIGGGTSNTRENLLTVDWSGNVWHSGDGQIDVSSYIINSNYANVTNAKMRIYGKVVQFLLELQSTTTIASGENVYTGTLYGIDQLPTLYVTGVGYYGARSIVGRIKTNGEIVVRNASSSAVKIEDGVSISFTYIIV